MEAIRRLVRVMKSRCSISIRSTLISLLRACWSITKAVVGPTPAVPAHPVLRVRMAATGRM
jgi:hypothetical protein